jgi:O-methyltransferase
MRARDEVGGTLRRMLGRGRSRAAEHDGTALDPADAAMMERVRPYTLTSEERLLALIDSVRYLARRGVPGAFAECGVWRGGSVLAMILSLQQLGVRERDLHLYDTFEGMTEPTERDTSRLAEPALETWREARAGGQRPWREFFDPETFNEHAVRATLLETGYPADRIHLHRGPVEQTLPATAPDALALLRLDTDWYESTLHELEHLYPRLATGGVLIIDDYGHWDGARQAVDEYFASGAAEPVLLSRVDYSCRIAVKH